MRDQDVTQPLMFSYRTLEERIPESHPLRKLRALVDEILRSMDEAFAAAYAKTGRASIYNRPQFSPTVNRNSPFGLILIRIVGFGR